MTESNSAGEHAARSISNSSSFPYFVNTLIGLTCQLVCSVAFPGHRSLITGPMSTSSSSTEPDRGFLGSGSRDEVKHWHTRNHLSPSTRTVEAPTALALTSQIEKATFLHSSIMRMMSHRAYLCEKWTNENEVMSPGAEKFFS